MKFSAALFTGLLATSATAFRMDVWQNKNYQGTQRAYVSPPHFMDPNKKHPSC